LLQAARRRLQHDLVAFAEALPQLVQAIFDWQARCVESSITKLLAVECRNLFSRNRGV
jgi:hypothetical protein